MLEVSESFMATLRKRSKDRIKGNPRFLQSDYHLIFETIELTLNTLKGMVSETKSRTRKTKLLSV